MQANLPITNRTFTESARRAQIVQAAMETIAELGYSQASFARIAERAGLKSTGLISYHFAGKQDLNADIVSFVLGDLSRWMHERLQAMATADEALEGYIRALIAYMQVRGVHLQALAELMLHGAMSWTASDQESVTSGLEDILRWGQEKGVFRSFDVTVMATTIQRSLDGLPFQQKADPALDLATYAHELVELFRRATAVDGSAARDKV
jgi:AcrR family transcriptional regulator